MPRRPGVAAVLDSPSDFPYKHPLLAPAMPR